MNHKRDKEDMQQPDLESLAFEKAADARGENAQTADAGDENAQTADAGDENAQAADAKTDREGGDGMDQDQNADKEKKTEPEDETGTADWMKRFESMPYEEAVVLLEKIVTKLESSELSLDESVTLFQQGMHLARICAGRLNEIEGKITKLIETEQEKMEEVPFDLD